MSDHLVGSPVVCSFMSDETTDEAFAKIDRLLDLQMLKHFEMAEMIASYRDMLADMQEQRRPDPDAIKLARVLPGAKYHVTTTYVRENWLVIGGELKKLFPVSDED